MTSVWKISSDGDQIWVSIVGVRWSSVDKSCDLSIYVLLCVMRLCTTIYTCMRLCTTCMHCVVRTCMASSTSCDERRAEVLRVVTPVQPRASDGIITILLYQHQLFDLRCYRHVIAVSIPPSRHADQGSAGHSLRLLQHHDVQYHASGKELRLPPQLHCCWLWVVVMETVTWPVM